MTTRPSNLPSSSLAALLAAIDELRTTLAELDGTDGAAREDFDDEGNESADQNDAERGTLEVNSERPAAPELDPTDSYEGPPSGSDFVHEHLALLKELVQCASEIRAVLRRIEQRGLESRFTAPPLAD